MVIGWMLVDSVNGQPPGTLPSPQAIGTLAPASPPVTEDAPAIVPKMFLVLDEAGNPVAVPGMTFEKLDDLLRMGGMVAERPALFDRVA